MQNKNKSFRQYFPESVSRVISCVWEKLVESKLFRFAVLAAFAAFGYKYAPPLLSVIHEALEVPGETTEYVKTLAITLPVIACLWYFRTYDIRQQIAESKQRVVEAELQVQQGNFVAGMNHILSDKALHIEVGTQILIGVSRKTPAFDAQIQPAFIKRLQQLPEKVAEPVLGGHQKVRILGTPGLSYVKTVLLWLYQRQAEHTGPILLDGSYFYYEEMAGFRQNGGIVLDRAALAAVLLNLGEQADKPAPE